MSPKTRKMIKDFEAKAKVLTVFVLMMIVGLTSVFVINPSVEKVSAGVYPGSCSYYKKLTIDHDQVPSNLVNFPVCVLIDDDSDMYEKVKSNLTDIEFWDSTNTTQYYHEVESYLIGGGVVNATIWVNVTSISSTVDTVFYLWYGNATDSSHNGYYPSSVWDNSFSSVFHLNNTDCVDSKNSNDGTNGGVSFTTGKMGLGGDFESGDNDVITCPEAVLPEGDTECTVSFWLKLESNSSTWAVISKYKDGDHKFAIYYDTGTNLQYKVYMMDGSGTGEGLNMGCNDADETGVWHNLVFIREPSDDDWDSHLDGSSDTLGVDGTNDIIDDAASVLIGDIDDAWSDMPLDGILDELRISSVKRNDSWINACYNNINNISGVDSFVSWGDEGEPGSTTGVIDFINSLNDYFTTSGVVDGSYYANNTGPSYETANLTVTPDGTNCEWIRINVSDIDTNITADCINISFDDDNSGWSGNWHSCTGGGESIIVNGSNWDANNWMSGNNPFTADSDGDGYDEIQSTTSIYWRVRVNYPSYIGNETYSKTDMTYDGGHYS